MRSSPRWEPAAWARCIALADARIELDEVLSGTHAPSDLSAASPNRHSVETHTRFSPDGRWIAYSDNDSGEMQVYVRRFRGAGEKLRVSVSGGGWPRWRGDGRELFFLSPAGELMSAALTSEGDALKIGEPQPLFKVRLRPLGRLDAYPYDVTTDGQRFLCNLFVDEATSSGLTLIVNWPAALR